MPSLLEWSLLENKFAANKYDGYPGEITCVNSVEGSPLCLTSVHAINHFRDGTPKDADIYTGSLTCLLAEKLNCSVIINLCRHTSIDSSKGIPPVEIYLQQMCNQNPNLMIFDIHGVKTNPNFEIAFGTGGDISSQQEIWLSIFTKKSPFKIAVNPEGYDGNSPRALTQRMRNLYNHSSIIQIEIARHYRSPDTDLPAANAILDFLIEKLSS